MAKFAAEDFLSDAELGLGRRGQMRFDPDGLDDSAFESASDSKQQRREERRLERKASVAAADAGSGASSSSAAAASSAALNSRRAYEDDDDYEAFAGDGPSNGSEEDSSGSFGAAFGEDSASGTADTAPVRARGGRKKGSSGGGGAGSSSRRGKGKGSIVRPHYSFDLNDYLPDASVGADGSFDLLSPRAAVAVAAEAKDIQSAAAEIALPADIVRPAAAVTMPPLPVPVTLSARQANVLRWFAATHRKCGRTRRRLLAGTLSAFVSLPDDMIVSWFKRSRKRHKDRVARRALNG